MINSIGELQEIAEHIHGSFPKSRLIHVFIESTKEEQKELSNIIGKELDNNPFIIGVELEKDPFFTSYKYLNVRFAFNRKGDI